MQMESFEESYKLRHEFSGLDTYLFTQAANVFSNWYLRYKTVTELTEHDRLEESSTKVLKGMKRSKQRRKEEVEGIKMWWHRFSIEIRQSFP
jgi:hypothetical protein